MKAIQATMKNHVYMLDDKVYHQSEGGPIGLQLTGAVARTFMLWWDKTFMEKLKEATKNMDWECFMYMRYVDDGNMVCTPFPIGCKVEDGSIIVPDSSAEEDDMMQSPPDRRTAEIIQCLANSICEFIQMEIDYPSAHESHHMPILDLEVAMVEDKIRFRHYRKTMANPLVIHQRSAMPQKVKRACLTNEVIRILRNTSSELPNEVKKFFVSDFSHRMRASGYPESFRREIILSGIKGFEKQVKRDVNGECPLHRPKGYQRDKRDNEKALKRRAWYRPFDSVFFCPTTPGGELAKRIRGVTRDVAERTGMSIKVVERGGVSLKSQLRSRRSNNICPDANECVIHKSGGRGDCSSQNIVYKGTCVTCRDNGITSKPDKYGHIVRVNDSSTGISSVYIGETSKTCYVRGKQHLECLSNPDNTRSKSNALVKHRELYHNGEEDNVQFQFEVIKSFKKPLERQVWEGVEIHSSREDIIMNSRLDHYQPAVGRMVMRFEP